MAHCRQAAKQARKEVDKNRKERSKLSSKPPEYLHDLQQEVSSLAAELAALGKGNTSQMGPLPDQI